MQLMPVTHYILGPDGMTPEPFDIGEDFENAVAWAMAGGALKTLAQDHFPCGGYVSTIFMGLAMNWSGPPQVFETMAFDGAGQAVFQHREHTYQRAMKTHAQVLAHVMEKAAG